MTLYEETVPLGRSRAEPAVTGETVDETLVTVAGYEQLRAELEHLRTTARAKIAAELRRAREAEARDDPPPYDLFEAQAQLEERIAVLQSRLAEARVVEPATSGVAGIGSRVRVRDRESREVAEYELVGAMETDIGGGRVSVGAPVGRALIGVRRGATVSVATPRGTWHLDVLDVRTTAQAGTAGET
jgi:transcription elongation factor GreA